MLKQIFFKLLNHELKNLSPQAKLVQLKIIKDYLNEYEMDIIKSFELCPICKRYSLKKDFTHCTEKRSNCYIGKYFFGDVTYLHSRCPLCGKITKKVLSTMNLIIYDIPMEFWAN